MFESCNCGDFWPAERDISTRMYICGNCGKWKTEEAVEMATLTGGLLEWVFGSQLGKSQRPITATELAMQQQQMAKNIYPSLWQQQLLIEFFSYMTFKGQLQKETDEWLSDVW